MASPKRGEWGVGHGCEPWARAVDRRPQSGKKKLEIHMAGGGGPRRADPGDEEHKFFAKLRIQQKPTRGGGRGKAREERKKREEKNA